jgi:hypothetical protein
MEKSMSMPIAYIYSDIESGAHLGFAENRQEAAATVNSRLSPESREVLSKFSLRLIALPMRDWFRVLVAREKGELQ